MAKSRRERREAELAERRDKRRRGQAPKRTLPVLPLSIAGLAVGAVLVIAFVVLGGGPPPPTDDVRVPIAPAPYALADGNALGRPDAPLAVEVWSDYQCPACTLLARTQMPQLIADYVETDQLRLVYRDFAFLGQESIDAAVGARCAADQDRFWQFHDYLWANHDGENRGAYSGARLELMAQAAGLDLEAFRACRADSAARDHVAADRAAGAAAGVTSTPTLFVGDEKVVGVPRSYADLATLIDLQLARAAAQR